MRAPTHDWEAVLQLSTASVTGARVALVTGGSRGIGRACVEMLAAAGHRVVAVGRDEHALEEVVATACGRDLDVEGVRCDVTSEDDVATLFDRVGPVDVLVNNAGAASAAPLHRVGVEEMEQSFRANVVGAFLCTRAALPAMRERDWGRIVFVASVSGLVGAKYTAAYTTAKHGTVGLMRAVAAEVAGRGITANAVCPTYVRSRMTSESVDRIAKATGRGEEAAVAALASASPLGRLLEPEEVAHAVAFFSSRQAGAINGQTLVMDGGGLQQ